jgi:magnesium transporter
VTDAHEAQSRRDEDREPPPFPAGEDAVSPDLVAAAAAAIASADQTSLLALTGDLPQADLAELLLALEPKDRPALIRLLGPAFDFAALTELDEGIRLQILAELPSELIARGLGALESDDAVYILEDLDRAEAENILARLPAPERIALRRSLDYPEESAGRLMQTDFIAVPPFWTVGQTIDYMRETADLPEEFYELFVVDPGYRLLGAVPLNRILRAKRGVKVRDLMDVERYRIRATEDREEAARLFERYNLVSAAVVDEADRLVGVITVDDAVDVIREEASEDLSRLAGVGDEEISDPVMDAVRSRLPWLLVNLGTALLASSVISMFDGAIARMVALAVLMPIVASMGGNAGTQTMAVAVRALAMREIGRSNTMRLVGREALVGLTNGVLLAFIVGGVAGAWFRDPELGFVIAVAMVTNLCAAGLAGILIPLTLHRLHVDPAVASSVFVTMVTDVVGFFAFLGFAAWWYGLG